MCVCMFLYVCMCVHLEIDVWTSVCMCAHLCVCIKFNEQTKQQISGTAIGTKFGPPYLCLWIKLKLPFLKPKSCSLRCGLDILTIFFYLDIY